METFKIYSNFSVLCFLESKKLVIVILGNALDLWGPKPLPDPVLNNLLLSEYIMQLYNIYSQWYFNVK